MPLSDLDEAHFEPLARGITNVFSTKIAQDTFAELVDGVPLRKSHQEAHGRPLIDALTHPARQHTALCPGTLERMEEFKAKFVIQDLELDAKTLLDYRAASPGSKAFNTRLIELVARAIHQIAVLILQADIGFHKDDGMVSWVPPKEATLWWRFRRRVLPTLFIHKWYEAFEQYPAGGGDMAGYWAEMRIIGGVVLFDRLAPENHDVFLHPDRKFHTYRIFMLTDDQKRQFLDFLASDTPAAAPGENGPLPFLPSEENRHRVDPEEPIHLTGVYRDPWERRKLRESDGDARSHTVWNDRDYLTLQDFGDAKDRWASRYERYLDKE